MMIAESAVADPFRATDSLAFASREANVDAPRRDLGILPLLGRSQARCRSPSPDSPRRTVHAPFKAHGSPS
ncbi:MAG TPA: hypothetical protein VN648_15205, partial [Candidatus Methylomirabilis sp.]|nr:hypothetical protein [Candidatus Methylomirabilis sp.]